VYIKCKKYVDYLSSFTHHHVFICQVIMSRCLAEHDPSCSYTMKVNGNWSCQAQKTQKKI